MFQWLQNWFRGVRLSWLARRMGVRRRPAVGLVPGGLMAVDGRGGVRLAQEGDAVVGVCVGTGVGADGCLTVSVQMGSVGTSVSSRVRWDGVTGA